MTTLAGILIALAGPLGGGEPVSHTFREPPVNSLGIRSLAELRGKPVLIDFWGTR
jgi:hypothetical protein